MGAYCRNCGYKKYRSSLQLHHINKEEKESPRDSLGLWLGRDRVYLLQKLSETSFTILCANCHIELHNLLKKKRLINIAPVDTTLFKDIFLSLSNELIDKFKKSRRFL